jgi:hypothetical protein
MTLKKILILILYAVSVIVFLAAIILFFMSISGLIRPFEDVGETTGTLLAVFMGFEMILFFAWMLTKIKKFPSYVKKLLKIIKKYLLKYHYSIGAIAISLMLLHTVLTLDLNNPWGTHCITGYIIVGTIILSTLIGLFYNKTKHKLFKRVHILTAFIAVLPFLFHLE